MQDYLNNNFFPVYRKYLVFLEKSFIGKFESTNNKLENYFGNTLDKHTKRIYRTPEGIFDYIMTRKNGWIENRKKVLTKWQSLLMYIIYICKIYIILYVVCYNAI